jgi:hypothetical protein
VNAVQSAPSQQSGSNKKTKNKSKNNNEQTKNQAQPLATEKQTQWKMKFPNKGKDTNGVGTLPDPSSSSVSLPSVNPPSGPLQIEKPTFDTILCPPKRTIHKSTFNPSSCAAQNYNMVEDLAQAPCVMYALEVLQHCPSQRRRLLATLDLESSNQIMFNLDNYVSQLSHQLAFQVHVVVHNQQIHRTILDEGASTCVMSLACWKGLKSPSLKKSPTMLRTFDGQGFHPHGLLQCLPIQLGGKTVTVDV